jgi:7-cyano-7-deazaguanine synthase in queuosine biosynthesis
MVQKPTVKSGHLPSRTLVMLSGGIDSTAALWHVLNLPDEYEQVHIHHIHIQNIEARWKAEAAAVKSVLAYMRKHTSMSFTTSESIINTPTFGNNFLFDSETIGFVTGYMTSRDPHINIVIIGGTATDFAMEASDAVSRGKAIHNAFHLEEKDHSGAVKQYPHRHLTKKQVYNTLPPELALLTWSCRTPRYVNGKPRECGQCKTCTLELRDIQRPVLPRKEKFRDKKSS